MESMPAVDASQSRHYPYLIAHTHVAILTHIALKGTVLVFDGKLLINRLVSIFERAGEVGLQVILVHPVASLQVFACMTNGIAILDDVLALLHIDNEHLVTGRCVLVQYDLFPVDLDDVALVLCLQANDNRIGRIDFQISF